MVESFNDYEIKINSICAVGPLSADGSTATFEVYMTGGCVLTIRGTDRSPASGLRNALINKWKMSLNPIR